MKYMTLSNKPMFSTGEMELYIENFYDGLMGAVMLIVSGFLLRNSPVCALNRLMIFYLSAVGM